MCSHPCMPTWSGTRDTQVSAVPWEPKNCRRACDRSRARVCPHGRGDRRESLANRGGATSERLRPGLTWQVRKKWYECQHGTVKHTRTVPLCMPCAHYRFPSFGKPFCLIYLKPKGREQKFAGKLKRGGGKRGEWTELWWWWWCWRRRYGDHAPEALAQLNCIQKDGGKRRERGNPNPCWYLAEAEKYDSAGRMLFSKFSARLDGLATRHNQIQRTWRRDPERPTIFKIERGGRQTVKPQFCTSKMQSDHTTLKANDVMKRKWSCTCHTVPKWPCNFSGTQSCTWYTQSNGLQTHVTRIVFVCWCVWPRGCVSVSVSVNVSARECVWECVKMCVCVRACVCACECCSWSLPNWLADSPIV